jgi:hypothetical protein
MQNRLHLDEKTPKMYRHAACAAEPAIVHLEMVIGHYVQSGHRNTPATFTAQYWLGRIAELQMRFDLLPPQKVRLDRLENALSVFIAREQQPDGTMARRAA